MKTRDSLQTEYCELEGQLQGISNKLPVYRKIKNRMEEIKNLLGDQVGGAKLKKTRKRKKYLAPFQRVH